MPQSKGQRPANQRRPAQPKPSKSTPQAREKSAKQLLAPAKAHFQQICGDLSWEEELRFACIQFERNPKLYDCTAESLVNAMLSVAATGLSLNPTLSYASLQNTLDSQTDQMHCRLMPQYQGMLHTVLNSGRVSRVWADVVTNQEIEEGRFRLWQGSDPKVEHQPDLRRQITKLDDMAGAYCCAELLPTGKVVTTWVPIEEIHKARESSPGWQRKAKSEHDPWNRWPGERAKVVAVKRATKMLPKSRRIAAVVAMDNAAQGIATDAVDHLPMPASSAGETADIDPPSPTITANQAEGLKVLMISAGLSVAKFCEWQSIESVGDLPAESYPEVQRKLAVRHARQVLRMSKPGDVVSVEDFHVPLEVLRQIREEEKREGVVIKEES